MTFLRVFVCLLIFPFLSCSTGETEIEDITDTVSITTPESFEAMPITNEYVYEITDKKTGKKKLLSQEEYLNSDYTADPSVEVVEKVKIH
ncbi:MAG: hypothetical protein ACK40M_04230 [Flavobacteriales bacterium]